MNNQLKAGLVRVLMGGRDVPLGVGFLISDKHVLTCAHVIAQVLSIPPDTPMMPTQTIRLEFPFVTLGTILTARVVRWYPVQFNASHALEDIAILGLESITPEAVRPLRLVTADDVWVKLNLKLPPWFTVPTPVGNYNPDWAIVLEERDAHGQATDKPLLYLVRETKGSTRPEDLRSDERRKTLCGKSHFEYTLGVDYKVVTRAEDL